MQYVRVAVHGLIKKDNKFLITKRPFDDDYMPDVWDLPGGTIKFQENIKNALIREINEETTLYDIEVDKEHSFVGNGCLLHNCTYEAMASGLPVIVSSNTGTKQHVFEGMQGFIVPPSDVKELSERIQYFYDNPELVKKMGRNARKMAEAFPWERHEQEYVKWIKSL